MSEMSLQDWSAQGFASGQGQQFANDVQAIAPLQLFIRALPAWSSRFDVGVTIQIQSAPDLPGVGIEMGFDRPHLSVEAAQQFIERLQSISDLMEMERLVEAMRELGVPAEYINPLVDKANELAAKINQLDQF